MANRVLFISGRCPHSKKILLGVNEYPFLKDLFKIVNVDTQSFPNYIKTVPAILINNQVVTGEKVFTYFGKLVESKVQQEQREKSDSLQNKDEGQCRINEDGLLEGYCGNGMDLEYSMISEKDDDCSKSLHKIEETVSFLDGVNGQDTIQEQVKTMEQSDNQLSGKRQQFDSDLERMQQERGEINPGGGAMGGRPPPQMDRGMMGMR
jgi:hypothetical protein